MKDDLVAQFIKELKKEKNVKVRKRGDINSPTIGFSFNHSSKSYFSSLEVVYSNHTDIYEFENKFKKDDLNELITKWIMLSIQAKRLSGVLYLVVYRKFKHEFNKVLLEKKIDAEIVILPGS